MFEKNIFCSAYYNCNSCTINRKFEQWRSTTPPLSTNQQPPHTSNHWSQERLRQMGLDFQFLNWDRHTKECPFYMVERPCRFIYMTVPNIYLFQRRRLKCEMFTNVLFSIILHTGEQTDDRPLTIRSHVYFRLYELKLIWYTRCQYYHALLINIDS